jgi:hypothetical protein
MGEGEPSRKPGCAGKVDDDERGSVMALTVARGEMRVKA